MPERFDAIVVGLGPAGAAAAIHLARAGARVLALDGRARRPKPCGGCWSERYARLLDEMGAPAWVRDHPVTSLWLMAPGRPARRFATQAPAAWLVDRGRLDAWLAQRAAAEGVTVVPARARAIVPGPHGVTVRTRRGEFHAPWLVGADGAAGVAARTLGAGAGRGGYRALAEERPLSDRLRAVLQGSVLLEVGGLPGGYAWAFARGDVVNLGVGSWRPDLNTGDLVRAHGRFLARLGLGKPGDWRGWLIPLPGLTPPRPLRGRVLLAGDAVPLGDPWLGEGIGPALFCGREAARAIMAGDAASYPHRLRPLWREHRHGRTLAWLIYRLGGLCLDLAGRHPGAIELAFNLLRGELAQRDLWRAIAARALDRPPSLDPTARGDYSKQLK